MAKDFWRYTSYDSYRNLQNKKEAAVPVEPVLPHLTPTRPKNSVSAVPAWMGGNQSIDDGMPEWLRGSQGGMGEMPNQPAPAPNWFRNTEPFGGEAQAPASMVTAPPVISPQLRAGPPSPADNRTYRWWERPTQGEMREWENNPTPGLIGHVIEQNRPKENLQTLADLAKSGYTPFGGNQTGGIIPADAGTPAWVGRNAKAVERQVTTGAEDTMRGLKTAGTSVDALVSTVLGTIDAWGRNGLLTPEETAQFETNYNSIDKNISPEIRAAMAREMLPRSTKAKILKIVDWTTQNLAKQAAGEQIGSWKGSIEGAKQGGKEGGIGGAIKGFVSGSDIDVTDAQGNVVGTKRAGIGKYIVDSAARMLVGGPALAVYGQGIDAKTILNTVNGKNGIDREALQKIEDSRAEWKAVQNSSPAAWQFVSEMALDPVNVVSSAMGAAAGLAGKQAAREGQIAYSKFIAEAAAAGLNTADMAADVQRGAKAAASLAQMQSMANQWTPALRTIYQVSQAADYLQNKGYLVGLPGENAVNMYLMMQAMSKLSPIAMQTVGEALGNIVRRAPVEKSIPEIARILADNKYAEDAKVYGNLPETAYYRNADGVLEKIPTQEYYARSIEDALKTPINVDMGDGRVYANTGEMLVDFIKSDKIGVQDLAKYADADLVLNPEVRNLIYQSVTPETTVRAEQPITPARQPAPSDMPLDPETQLAMNRAYASDTGRPQPRQPVTAPTDAAYFSEGDNMPLNRRFNELYRDILARRTPASGDISGTAMYQSARDALAQLSKEKARQITTDDLRAEKTAATARPEAPAQASDFDARVQTELRAQMERSEIFDNYADARAKAEAAVRAEGAVEQQATPRVEQATTPQVEQGPIVPNNIHRFTLEEALNNYKRLTQYFVAEKDQQTGKYRLVYVNNHQPVSEYVGGELFASPIQAKREYVARMHRKAVADAAAREAGAEVKTQTTAPAPVEQPEAVPPRVEPVRTEETAALPERPGFYGVTIRKITVGDPVIVDAPRLKTNGKRGRVVAINGKNASVVLDGETAPRVVAGEKLIPASQEYALERPLSMTDVAYRQEKADPEKRASRMRAEMDANDAVSSDQIARGENAAPRNGQQAKDDWMAQFRDKHLKERHAAQVDSLVLGDIAQLARDVEKGLISKDGLLAMAQEYRDSGYMSEYTYGNLVERLASPAETVSPKPETPGEQASVVESGRAVDQSPSPAVEPGAGEVDAGARVDTPSESTAESQQVSLFGEAEPAATSAPTPSRSFTRPDGSVIERAVGKPVDVVRVAGKVGDESGETLHIPSRYVLGELDDVQPSHLLGSFERNPLYPEEMQPREYKAAGVKGVVQSGIDKPYYRSLVAPNETVDEGPPLVRNDGVIINGTNRRLILEGISRDPVKWSEYQAELKKALAEVGIPEEELAKFEKPILYRVANDDVPPEDIMLATKAAPTTKEMNTAEAAKSQAQTVDLDMLMKLNPHDTPTETLRADENQDFIQAYLNQQPLNHRTALLSADGKLTEDGVAEIRNAMFLAVYGKKGERMLNAFTSEGGAKSVQDAMFNSLPDIAKAESMIHRGLRDKELSLADDIISATDALIDMRNRNMDIGDYLAQGQLAGFEVKAPLTVTQRHLLTVFDEIAKGRRVGMRRVLKAYADKVVAPPQMTMFGDTAPRTAGQLLNEALIENGIEGVTLFDSVPRVQAEPKPDTPADSPQVDFEKPTYLTTSDEHGNNTIEWGQVVDRDGTAVLKERPVFKVREADWLGYNDRVRRALVEKDVNDSIWATAKDKKQRIDDIIKATDEWARQLQEARSAVRQGGIPQNLVDDTPPPAQPAPGGSGAQQPPNKPPVTPAPPQPQQPSGKQPGSMSPQQPMAGMPPSQPPTPGAQGGRRPGTRVRNPQSRMNTAQGATPPSAAGGNDIFSQKQFTWQKIVDDFRADAPRWTQSAQAHKATRAVTHLTRAFYPETGAFIPSAVIGKVYGRAISQGVDITKQATLMLKTALSDMEATGLKLKDVDVNGKKAQVIDGLALKPESEWPATVGGQPVPDEFKTMQPIALDVLSNPDFFKPTTTDAALAQRQIDALNAVVNLTQKMFTEMTNDAASRGIKISTQVRQAQYYIPRSVDETDDIAHAKPTDHAAGRRFVTVTQGMTDPDDATTYFPAISSITEYIRGVSARIANRETELALHDLIGARYVDELISPDYNANITRLNDAVQTVDTVKNIVNQLERRGNVNFGTSPQTMPQEVSWLNSQLDPADDLWGKMFNLARETDPQARKALASDIKDIVYQAGRKYATELKAAERELQGAREQVTQGQRVHAGFGWDIPQGHEHVEVRALKNVKTQEAMYLPETEAAPINAWFGADKKSPVMNALNEVVNASKLFTQSADIEMTTRMATMLLQDPGAFVKSLIWSVRSPDAMDRWMNQPEILELINKGRRWGLNLDMSSEIRDAFSELRQNSLTGKFTDTAFGKRMQQLSAGAANYAQIMYLARELPHIEAQGRRAAARKGIATPEGIQREIDIQGRGAIKAFQDHVGLRSMLDAGSSPAERTFSRLLFMSGRKTSGWISVPFNITKSGELGNKARQFVSGEIVTAAAAATAVAGLNALLTGREIDWKEFLNPASPYFLTTVVGGTRLSPGGGILRDIRQLGTIYNALERDPKSLSSVDLGNPLLQYWVTRGSMLPNVMRTVMTGRNFAGVKIDTPEEIAREAATYIVPMSLQDFTQTSALDSAAGKKVASETSGSVGWGKFLGTFNQWIGGRALPESPYMLLKKARNDLAKTVYHTTWDKLDQVDKWQLERDYPDLGQLEQLMLEAGAEKDNPMDMFKLDVQEEHARLDAEAAVYRAQFLAGKRPDGSEYTGQNYRDDINKLDSVRARLPMVIKASNPAYKDVPVTKEEKDAYYAKYGVSEAPVDKFITKWYQITEDSIIDKTTSQINFDLLFANREALIAQSDPFVVAKAMSYINRNKEPELLAASKVYQEYMALPKYDGVTQEQADLIDEFKEYWTSLRLAGVTDPKTKAAQKYRKGYALYEIFGKKTSLARRKFMYKNATDSSMGYTDNGLLINLFYNDLTLPELLENQPQFASSFAE